MLTYERLLSLLEYEPAIGKFYWRRRRHKENKGIAGTMANTGYKVIKIDGSCYMEHRLAWLYMTKHFPEHELDHIDTRKDNNIWSNLREATRSQNNCNRKMGRNNTSGIKGVHWDQSKNCYIAQIQCNYKKQHLGCFANIQEAEDCVKQKRKELHGEFRRDK